MATREKRLAQFDGNGEPPPDQPVEVLCEDHSGTYQLPFACRWIDGHWRNDRTGGMVEATVVGWRLPRVQPDVNVASRRLPTRAHCARMRRNARAIFKFGTAMERIAPESLIWRRTPLFTARCRPESEAAHHMQHGNDRPQPAADDKG